MRLHELTITAFGPFAETVHVDFDELAASGLFLLTGETGAGKSSVLDAVCFALYGEVPGDRHQARHLRCDQAADGVEPRVELRVSIGERTFRFVRSPAWHRPKRRGVGTTRIQAHVVVEEQRGAEWTALTNRLDEAGHLVSELLGMTCAQFTQVAMLPQGRFQAFLRASSAERHGVLQRLFRTRRYDDVEKWFAARRVELHRTNRLHHDRTAAVLSRQQEAAHADLPEGWDLADLGAVGDGTIRAWHTDLTACAATDLAETSEELASASESLTAARAELDRARAADEARARGERARRTLTELDATEADERGLVSRLDAHRRASAVLPLALRVEEAERAHAEAVAVFDGAQAAAAEQVGRPVSELGLAELDQAATRSRETRAVAESWLPRERDLHDEQTRRTALAAETVRLAGDVSAVEEQVEELDARCEHLRAALADARAAAATRTADVVSVDKARRGLDAAREVTALTTQLDEAERLLREAVDRAQALREVHLDLRERRIAGMAAELATGLAAGCACPVCGSADHPSPAAASSNVTRADEERARDKHETADFTRQAHQESVATLRTRLEAHARTADGSPLPQWQRRYDDAVAAAERSGAAQERVGVLTDRLRDDESARERATRELAGLRVALAERTREHEEAASRCERLETELAELLATAPGATSVSALVEQHTRLVRVLDDARAAADALERCGVALAEDCGRAEAVATEAGFGTPLDARRAVLATEEATDTERRLEERRSARAGARAVLAEPNVAAALAGSSSDLAGLAETVATLEHDRDRAHAARRQAEARHSRLDHLGRELAGALDAWAPVRDEHALVARLASLVEGTSADNRLRMRLSAYVLGERLRQVVAAANERLGHMTGERYTLAQADEKGAGEQRGGLSLRVRDEWSGKVRDTATLSGGETFVVSLALALGLADTVSHEAGGTQLDTLFVDEGFGSLDAGTLDGVMDTLDALRDGGRVVGLVSHVAELRNRVPTQLEVRKARRGSTLEPVLATG